ncbi:hypothetical protein [Hymenobacter crusticola]|nr:hypothetical protein [Hymenobacter crusticola]
MEQRIEIFQVPVKAALGSAPGAAVDSIALNKLLEPWQGMHWRISSISTQIVAYEAAGARPGPFGSDATRYTAFVSVLMYHTATS